MFIITKQHIKNTSTIEPNAESGLNAQSDMSKRYDELIENEEDIIYL